MTDLTSQETHFRFGENWRDFSQLIDDPRIRQSDEGVARLLSHSDLRGRTVIDIGCGSGLPALSMLRAGAAHVTCVDIDPDSVATTRRVLSAHAPAQAWSAERGSVFDLSGAYDVVYSWGVLHHTGAMWAAVDKAMGLVKPGGLLAIAIYAKTPFCDLWRLEKRVYSRLPAPVQKLINLAYTGPRVLARALKLSGGVRRGMDLWHDGHDWLGGYPYESASPEEIHFHLHRAGFEPVRELLAKRRLGVTGTGCDEYVFRRR